MVLNTKTAMKAFCCLLLCLPLLVLHWQRAAAQTSTTPPMAPVTSTAAPPTPAPPATAPMVAAPAKPAPAASPPVQAQTAPLPLSQSPGAQNPPIIQVSILSMVRNADVIVQGVMLFLLFCSGGSWAVFLYKSVALAWASRNTERFSTAFRNAATMDDAGPAVLAAGAGPAGQMWVAASEEWELTLRAVELPLTAHQSNRLLQRLVLAMGTAQERSLTQLGSWMGLLATIGSTAPFIGLFGTVWGILDSFEHISASSSTSLTVVAPGIAEALLATAVGLFTAIPATMFYNRFARELGKITGMLDNVTAEMIVFASRDVERLGK
jgi:biopolymer transport protein ExbB/TolQ